MMMNDKHTIMFNNIKNKFTTKLMIVLGLILLMPALTYLIAILITSFSVKQSYVKIIDEYGMSEKEGEEFVLEQETKGWIKRVSIDVARQIDLFLDAYPALTAADLARDGAFRELALQPVGSHGYTFIADVTAQNVLVHPTVSLEQRTLDSFNGMPELGPILARISEGKFSEGDYRWPAGDGATVRKYMFSTPVPTTTGDGHRLAVGATADMDEIAAPARQRSQGQAVKHILNLIENRRTRDILVYSLLASGAMGALLILFASILLSKGIAQLQELSAASAAVRARMPCGVGMSR